MTARYSTARCACGCGLNPTRPFNRQVPKHKDRDKVLKMARKAVESFPESGGRLVAEALANVLDADLAAVKHALHKLNLEGLVDKPRHSIPHDSSRDPWLWGKGFSAWQANIYRVIPKDQRKPRK